MKFLPVIFLLPAGILALAIFSPLSVAAGTEAKAAATMLPPLTAGQQAAHVLNRLGYGPRPGEIAAVARSGVQAWMIRQLDPQKIPDPAAEAALAKLPKLHTPAAELVAAYQAEIRTRRRERSQQSEMPSETGDAMAAEVPKRQPSPEQQANHLLIGEALGDLMHAKLARAVMSERQLEEVLVDFWFNHFNVDARKQQVRAVLGAYEQEVIRPHIWGNFRELLGATAHSPAMLVYLDNFRSSRAYTPGARELAVIRRLQEETIGADPANPAPAPVRGLNENYGRELLELHTLGVEGGYSQQDVQEVARAFTGWTIEPKTGAFIYRRRWHDDGAKIILGRSLPAGGGEKDGERVLDLLAMHPATAHHLSYLLCQRFVADAPPADYVERVAQAYLRSKGDLRATYRALFLDPAFLAPQFFGTKAKSPFEFVASSLRATEAEFATVERWPGRLPLHAVEAGAMLGRNNDRLANLKRKTVLLHLIDMGQPLYSWGPPTGFAEDSTHWVGAGALVARLNFALALSGGQVPDARVAVRPLLSGASIDDPGSAVDAIAGRLLAGELTASTRRILIAQGGLAAEAGQAVVDAPRVVALLLGSPEFQRR